MDYLICLYTSLKQTPTTSAFV